MLQKIMGEKVTAAHIGVAAILYSFAHGLVTMAAGPALALDDVKINVVTQSFQWGYQPANPPLFEWLLLIVQQGVGPTLLSFVVVKYLLLSATVLLVFLAAKDALGDRRWAGVAALSLALCYQIGWNFHQAFTHSAALIFAIAFFWWALLRLLRTDGLQKFVLFGAAVGIGLLAKYSFAVGALVGLAAVATHGDARRAVFKPALLLSFVTAAIISAPHIYWVATENTHLAARAASRLQGPENTYWMRIAQGLPDSLWAVASFILPFGLVALAARGRRLFAWRALSPAIDVLRRASLIGACALPAAVIFLGIGNMQERYGLALLFPVIFWFVGELKASDDAGRAMRIAVVSCIVLLAAALSLRAFEVAFPGPPLCNACRQWVPYNALKKALDAEGVELGTLAAFEDTTAGNLRRLYPQERILSAHMPFYTPPGGAEGDKCYFIWSEDLGPRPPDHVMRAASSARLIEVEGIWPRVMRGEPRRTTTWTIVEMSAAPDLAKRLCRLSGT